MVNPERIKALCHPEVFKRIPVGEVEALKIKHQRIVLDISYCTFDGENKITVSSKGGLTTAEIIINGNIFTGKAHCSLSDNFCKKTGRELAFKRAIRQYWDYIKCQAEVEAEKDAVGPNDYQSQTPLERPSE